MGKGNPFYFLAVRSSRLCRSLPRELDRVCHHLALFQIEWTKAVVWGQGANRGRERRRAGEEESWRGGEAAQLHTRMRISECPYSSGRWQHMVDTGCCNTSFGNWL